MLTHLVLIWRKKNCDSKCWQRKTKGWRCSYCTTADRSASPSNSSRTCPRLWNVEIGKRFLHFLLAWGSATWSSEIELASSGLREKICSKICVKNTLPNKTLQ